MLQCCRCAPHKEACQQTPGADLLPFVGSSAQPQQPGRGCAAQPDTPGPGGGGGGGGGEEKDGERERWRGERDGERGMVRGGREG